MCPCVWIRLPSGCLVHALCFVTVHSSVRLVAIRLSSPVARRVALTSRSGFPRTLSRDVSFDFASSSVLAEEVATVHPTRWPHAKVTSRCEMPSPAIRSSKETRVSPRGRSACAPSAKVPDEFSHAEARIERRAFAAHIRFQGA